MAEYNAKGTLTALDGLFKDVYGSFDDLLPKGLKCQRDMKFRTGKKLGEQFVELVLLAHEHGVTYAAETDDAFLLATAIAGQTKPAKIQGSQILIRSRIGYKAAVSATSGGEQAFKRSFDVVVDNLVQSGRKRVEIDLLYGRQGLGSIKSVAGDVITIDDAEWAPGIWAGMENAQLEFFDAAGTTARVATDAFSIIKVVDLDAHTVEMESPGQSLPTDVVATDIVWFKGAHTTTADNSMLGLHGILTASATLFSIDTTLFSLWKPSTFSAASAQLTFPRVQKAIYRAISKGMEGDLVLYVNPTTWADMLQDEAAVRRHNQARRYDVGSEGITYYSQNGTTTIKASIYVKEGFAYLIPIEKYWRVGSTDLTFNVLGESDSYFLWVADRAAYEMRMYSDQALFTPCPGQSVLINNIVNAT